MGKQTGLYAITFGTALGTALILGLAGGIYAIYANRPNSVYVIEITGLIWL